ncbi:MarR family transcriptional regulator [Novosphingobium sp.]|uniref:MarR family transcriptional regulator n=1 Tax=Novosphingobium sp. TaxID=1874826 RepID=UPI00262AC4BF|nr:MarR family transcriptional regulator [Novosphingobium sp.]
MAQAVAQFEYPHSSDAGWPHGKEADDLALLRTFSPLAVSIFADRAWLRSEMAQDAAAAGLRVSRTAELAALADGRDRTGSHAPLGDLVLVDCPVLEPVEMAALSQLDQRVAQAGAQMVVSTSMGSLDDVFGCLDQSAAQILVSPSRADRVLALGQLLCGQGSRVRELSDNDRMSLLRLTQQVSEIAHKLEALSGSPLDEQEGNGGIADRVGASAFSFDGSNARDPASQRLVRSAKASLPDPRLVRKIIRQRQLRARFFEGELFADPAWDMLLDLTAARAEHKRVSVTSLCIAAGVPPTTALRWISQLTATGLFCRAEDVTDRRRAFIALSDGAADGMARYFAELGNDAALL